MKVRNFLALDYGTSRIGVAVADSQVKIAIPQGAIEVDGSEIVQIKRLLDLENIDTLVIGYPRNQSGEATKQTELVEQFAEKLRAEFPKIAFQDESLTSVLAEERLKTYKKPYSKADIDAMSAVMILEDYLKENHVA